MEVELTNHEDVAEPDQVVSGTAGTGQEHGIETRKSGKTEEKRPHATHERVVLGLGVLYNGKIPPCTIQEAAQDPVTPQEAAESYGDLIFSLFEREDRIRDRIQKKIERFDQRITKLEDRRRSQ
ncbi:MAG: hypothetical protein NTZ39_10485 [Methanoregula sp.]|nr:hypothetical protein [Methanoregula sp.]